MDLLGTEPDRGSRAQAFESAKVLPGSRAILLLSTLLSVVLPSSRASEPPLARTALTVRAGALLKGGQPYRGIGVNYFGAFHSVLFSGKSAELDEQFKILSRYHVPFCRVAFCGFWPSEWNLYQTNKAEYFSRMD